MYSNILHLFYRTGHISSTLSLHWFKLLNIFRGNEVKISPLLNCNVCENVTKILKICFHFCPEIPNLAVYPKGLLAKILKDTSKISFVALFLKVMKLDSLSIKELINKLGKIQ